jgi:hypothetical protein
VVLGGIDVLVVGCGLTVVWEQADTSARAAQATEVRMSFFI